MISFNILFDFLNSIFPNAHCELNYTNDYELLIAIMLSAQTTDKAVNKVTSILFSKYKNIKELNDASIDDIERIVSFLGMGKKKAYNIKQISNLLVTKYDCIVPKDPSILVTFPGVGNKTKNCFLAEYYHMPYLAIDTHVQRISKRLNLVNEKDNVEVIENKLNKFIPDDKKVLFNHQLISFGRNICKAKNLMC